MTLRTAITGLGLMAILGACEGRAPPPPLPDGALYDAGAGWMVCDWSFSRLSRESCASMEVPLSWDDPEGPSIAVEVKRFGAPAGATAQLWMLQGGPGGSAFQLEPLVPLLQERSPGLEVYLLEHRGVGRSSRLGCPDQESPASEGGFTIVASEIDACVDHVLAEWGEDLSSFRTEEAARDLGHAIEQSRRAGLPVYVYGVSYGTWWAHHWLHRFPAQADGVILDSICSPGTCRFPLLFSENFERIGQEILTICAADAECSGRFDGADPGDALRGLLADWDTGHCPEVQELGIDSLGLRALLGTMVRHPITWVLVPSLYVRLSRCEASDVEAVRTLLAALSPIGARPGDVFDSPMLLLTVVRGELADRPTPSWDEVLSAQRDQIFVSLPVSEQAFAASLRLPDYDEGPNAETFAATSVPMLLLNGEHDPQTPRWSAAPAVAAYGAAFQSYVEIARAPHAILSFDLESASPCGLELITAFLADPEGALPVECAERTPIPSFADDPPLAGALYGQSSLFGPSPPSIGLDGAPLRPPRRPHDVLRILGRRLPLR